jgi:hypothetical protein
MARRSRADGRSSLPPSLGYQAACRAEHETGELERETGLEPATFSLEGLGDYASQHRAQGPERDVSSYRVVRGAAAGPADRRQFVSSGDRGQSENA